MRRSAWARRRSTRAWWATQSAVEAAASTSPTRLRSAEASTRYFSSASRACACSRVSNASRCWSGVIDHAGVSPSRSNARPSPATNTDTGCPDDDDPDGGCIVGSDCDDCSVGGACSVGGHSTYDSCDGGDDCDGGCGTRDCDDDRGGGGGVVDASTAGPRSHPGATHAPPAVPADPVPTGAAPAGGGGWVLVVLLMTPR